MNYTTLLQKGKSVLSWIYNTITNKFTNILDTLKRHFPILDKYPLLKYSLIPIFIALFALVRNVLKLGINELATWGSGFVGDTYGFEIPERTIVLSITGVIISLRIGLKLWNQFKKKVTVEALGYERSC